MIDKVMLEEIIYNSPLALLTLNRELIEQANNYLPYSTAFEIECNMSDTYNEEAFKTVPNIVSIDVDSYEQRYRLPNGVLGFICLYHICHHLHVNSLLNMESGIHYHVDCKTDGSWGSLTNKVLDDNSDWILPLLDEWGYRGFQSRNIGSKGIWIRRNGLQTLEFRIGNMSFDYKVLVKNIISANSIVRRLKEELGYTKVEFKEINKKQLFDYQRAINRNTIPYQSKIANINKQLEEIANKKLSNTTQNTSFNEAKELIKNRSHKIN